MSIRTKLFELFNKLLAKLLGTFSWTPPFWLKFLKKKILEVFFIIQSFVNKNRKKVLIVSVTLISLSILVIAGLSWYYKNLPQEIKVSGTSPGLTKIEDVLKPNPIYIRFSKPVAKLEQLGKKISDGITISPAIEGEWHWFNDSQLIFEPKKDWGIDQKYTVRMEKTLFTKKTYLSTYEHTFKSAPFKAMLSSFEFYQDPENPKIKKVVATVNFTHPVNTADFEKRIKLRMEGQKGGFLGIGAPTYPFTISYDKYKSEAYIHSNPVEIGLKDTSMLLTISEGISAEAGGTAFKDKIEQEVKIPGMYNFFRINNAQVSLVRNQRYEPEQVLVIQTTAGALESELQKNLSVYVLPQDRPALQGQPIIKNYHWSDTAQIGPEILNLSIPLKLQSLPTDRDYATLHSFKYTAEPGKYLYIKLNKGIKSYGGYILAKDFDKITRIPEFPKELGIMLNGAILSLSGERKLPVYSRNIDAVKFEIGRVLPDQINHLISQSSGDFSSPSFNNYIFNEDNIVERFSEIRNLNRLDPGKTQYSAFDFSKYLSSNSGINKGLFFFKVESWDVTKNSSTGISDKRLILITDLGVLVKDNTDGSHDIFVQSIHTGEPVARANVDVLGKNGISILSATTNQDGHAVFPKMSNFTREKTPTVYLIRKGNDFSFLAYNRNERKLNLSRFDIGGEVTKGSSDRLSAYLFSDRGIYRPGDEFHVGIIVKPSDWKGNLTGIPLEVAINDSRGLEVKKQKITLSSSGFHEINYKTEESSPTGTYHISIYIVKDGNRGNLLDSTTVRIEEFLPDRMKITTRLSQERAEGWVSSDNLKGLVGLKNLFGTPAVNRRISANITLSPVNTLFRDYKDYIFFDPISAKNSFSESLKDKTTDEKGETEFELNLERFEKATYRLTFQAEGFEAQGGRGVISESTVIVSPLKYLVGYKADGNLKYINKNSDRSIELIAIDPSLKKISISELKGQIIEERYVSVLTQQSNNTYKYQSVRKEILISEKDLAIKNTGTNFKLPTEQPGDYLLIIKNRNNVELNRISFSVAGHANLTRNLEKNAELQIKLNKADFSPGEEIEISIKAPYTGAGLITIEREKVYSYKWFKTNKTSSVQKIVVPHNLEGNGYVNVAFIRATDSDEIFMSPLSYGVVPFSVSHEKRNIDIKLDTPAIARPGEPFKITYRSNRNAKIVIFAVDEGILQVAKYNTPDPLAHFFKKRALEVTTTQILDLILPQFSLVKGLSSPSGDEDARSAIGKNLNPFKRKRDKSVVFWSGIIDADTNQKQLVYNVPDYFNGTLRVMAVAVSSDAVGAANKKTQVRGHFVISPNVPTFAAPGDEFIVSVSVANNIEGSGKDTNVNFDVKTSAHLELLEKPANILKISEGRETTTFFKVRTKPVLGSGNLTFTASKGDKTNKFSVDLSIRPPLPFMTTIESGYFKSGKVDVSVTRKMYPQFRSLETAASPLPLGIAHGLVSYLNKFPYGCTEQLISQAFPAIVLRNRPEFGYAPNTVKSNLERVIDILRARQNAEGAFGFWAANSHVSDFQTVYAMHFLTEAKEKGYPIPQDILDKGFSYLHLLSSHEGDTLSDARKRAYAIYILTRNGIVTTNYLTSLQELLEKKFSKEWKKDLTGTYMAATFKLLKLDRQANSLIGESKFGRPHTTDYDNYYDSLVHDSQYLYILSKHFKEQFKNVSGDDILNIVKPVMQNNYNTISSSYVILAMDAYADLVGQLKSTGIIIKEITEGNKTNQLEVPNGLFPRVNFSDKTKQIHIESKNGFNTFYQVTQAGFDRALPDKEIQQKLEIHREYQDLNGKVITKTQLGSEIEVHLKIRSLGKVSISNIAIVDLLPGGFEPVLENRIRTEKVKQTAVYHTQRTDNNVDQVEDENNGENEEETDIESNNTSLWVSSIGTSKSTWNPQYTDIREDRVVVFGTVGTSAQEFVYRIKATNKGKYTVPPAFGESMYDRTIKSRTLGGTIIVE